MARTSLKSATSAVAPKAASQQRGTTRCLGPWVLENQVGQGELATVFRARPCDTPADRPAAYAVKCLRPEWEEHPAAIEMLRREALIGQTVRHPHLISVLSSHVIDAPYFLVMPWLNGMTLSAQLAAGPPPSLPQALWLVRQVAEALGALHDAGWMHADVKPGNIFVSHQTGHATLLDLGFARRHDERGSLIDRCVVGTAHYIAPEAVTSTLRTDIRSDIYSLGVTLFELLTGRVPFQGDSVPDVAGQHVQQPPPEIRRLVPHLPRAVAQLVHQMLAKEPLRRPQTPGELIERLVAVEIASLSEYGYD